MTEKMFRGRRSRLTREARALSRETVVESRDLIYPIFVIEGKNKRIPVDAMPGIDRMTVDEIPRELERMEKVGVSSIMIFGVPDHRDGQATEAWKKDGIAQQAVRFIKDANSEISVFADVCLCGATDHGHCGVISGEGIDNDATLSILSSISVSLAESGADVISPSDMMDGRIGAIRERLNEAGFKETPILSYAAKYASAFYGPFREAAGSSPKKGDRKSYQMDPANHRQAMREIEADIAEGADFVMVKPALSYLDVIFEAKERTDVPVFAYNVSGEYAMVKAAAAKGWVDEQQITKEILTSIKRAGADKILTYHALSLKS